MAAHRTHAGATRIDGGDGTDTFNVRTISGHTTIAGGGHNDTINVGSLTPNTAYSVAVYEYAGTGVNIDYLLAPPAVGTNEGTQTTPDYAVHNYDYRVDCGNCHDHGSFGARDVELKTICETCHNDLGVASAKLEFDNHLTPNKNPAIEAVGVFWSMA